MSWAADGVTRLAYLPDGWLHILARIVVAELARRERQAVWATATLADACHTADVPELNGE